MTNQTILQTNNATISTNNTELADILGHNSLDTTRVYTRTSDAQKKEKLEKLKF